MKRTEIVLDAFSYLAGRSGREERFMIEDVPKLLQVAGTLQDALGRLDHIVGTSPAAVHLQWSIDLIRAQVETLGIALLPTAPAQAG